MTTFSAIILAAGQGKRMSAISKTTPKELICLQGKPILVRIIERIQKAGIEDICVVTSPTKFSAVQQVLMNYVTSPSVKVSIQEEALGPAHAIRIGLSVVADSDSVLVHYGDSFCRDDVIPSVLTCSQTHQDGVIVVRKVEDPQRYGIVALENGLPVSIVEKPALGMEPSNLAVMGVFTANKNALEKSFDRTDIGVGKEQFPISYLIDAGFKSIGIVKYEGLRVDLGTPADLLPAALMVGQNAIQCIAFDGDNTLYPTKHEARKADAAAFDWLATCVKEGNSSELCQQWRSIVDGVLAGEEANSPEKRSRIYSYALLCHALDLPEKTASDMYEVFTNALCENIKPFPGALELLDWCDSNKIPFHLFTEDNKNLAEKKLAAMGIIDRFKSITCAEDVGAMKPHPDYYRKISTELNSVVVVGDNYAKDLEPASRLGAYMFLIEENQENDCLIRLQKLVEESQRLS